jgi:hypothetical protein
MRHEISDRSLYVPWARRPATTRMTWDLRLTTTPQLSGILERPKSQACGFTSIRTGLGFWIASGFPVRVEDLLWTTGSSYQRMVKIGISCPGG